MPVHDLSILFLISLIAFVNAAVLAWAARLGASRRPAWLFALGSFLLGFASLTILLIPDPGSPWRAAGLNVLPVLSYSCWLLGMLYFAGRRQQVRVLIIAIAVVLLAICWVTWITPLRDWRIFLVTVTLASLRALTAMVLIGHRDRLDRHTAMVFAAVLLIEAAAMLTRSITVIVGDLPGIGADNQSTTTLTLLAVLFAAVLSTPLLMLLGLSRVIVTLRDAGNRLQATLDALPDLVFELDASGRFESVHTRQANLLVLPPEQFLGRLPEDVLPAEVAATARAVMAVVDQHGYAAGTAYALELADGEHWFEVTAATRPASTPGKAPGYVFVTRDISERVRAEQMKREFVSVVSHELRTPLTSITGALDLLASANQPPLPAQSQRLLEIARNNSQRLRLLIDDLLDMEKLVAGKMRFELTAQPLRPMLQAAVDSNQTYGAGRQIGLALQEPVPDCQVAVDGQRFAQMLSNLLSNAIKFSPQTAHVELSAVRSDAQVQIRVRDHGPGVAAAFQSRLFEPFSQADASDRRQQMGTGLGLAITRGMAERMHGSVRYEDAPGGGACFVIELPVIG
ncbi:MAG: ATP-binding protein [Pseudomonadota bacterium]